MIAWLRRLVERLTPARTDDDDSALQNLERRMAALDAQIETTRYLRERERAANGGGGHHAIR